jgi:hypothetical protein
MVPLTQLTDQFLGAQVLIAEDFNAGVYFLFDSLCWSIPPKLLTHEEALICIEIIEGLENCPKGLPGDLLC